MSPRLAIGLALAIVFGVLLNTVPVIVNQTEKAIVLTFGDPIRVIETPGLNYTLPWQSVVRYDNRVLDFDLPAARVTAADQKPMVVDAYARFRIVNPLLFYQTVGTELAARQRLTPIMSGAVRNVISTVNLGDVVSAKREPTMRQIRDDVNKQTKGFGIDITDVRLRRADLPEANSQAIYSRMKSDRQRTEILAQAQKESQILKGAGDADSIRIYADAFGQDRDFFMFYRSLEAYRNSLSGQDTTFVLSPESEFFHYFGTAPAPR
jgi:modulator of FtsH protease HflC